VGFRARSRWSAAGRNKKAARLVAGFVTLETLSGWGARYPEKKARRLALDFEFDGIGVSVCERSRIFRRVWVTDFASLGSQKARWSRDFWLIGLRKCRVGMLLTD